MIKELTQTQERFLDDLRDSIVIINTMTRLQTKYQENNSKAQVKRDIESLINDGIIERKIMRSIGHGGRYTSATSYKLK